MAWMDRINSRAFACLLTGSLIASAPLAIAQPAATAPAPARTASERTRASLAPLLQQGADALAAGQIPAAREAFLDALAIDTRNVRALHGAGICALMTKDMGHARDAFERALTATQTPDRALVLNAAAFNLAMRNNMRAAKLARDYLTAHPKELDEPVLNALGTALTRASAVERKNRFFLEFASFYELANKRLEAARPGYKRFGAAWYTSSEVDAKMVAFSSQQKQIDAASDQVAIAEEKLIAARIELARQQALAIRGEGLSNPYLLSAQSMASYCEANADAAKRELERVAGSTERPTFPEQITPVGLDDLTAPELSRPVVAIATKPDPFSGETPFRPRNPSSTPRPRPAGTGIPKTTEPKPVPKPVVVVVGENPSSTPIAPAKPVAPVKRRVTQYAAAFAISPTHVVTAASSIDGATSIQLQTSDGQSMSATLVRKDEATGLAILSVEGRTLAPLALADSFTSGAVTCPAYPTVDLFNPAPQLIAGTAAAIKEGSAWSVSLSMHPRLPGSPILSGNKVVGVCTARRDAERTHLPTVSLEPLRAFIGSDAKTTGRAPDPVTALLQVVATREVGE